MQMYVKGMTVEEMKAAIDREYGHFGPSNMP
jgi:transposase-like protein